jgi:RimJ/RimL family protein N-acetyltransferase
MRWRTQRPPVAPMSNKGDLALSELHATIPGGERVLIREVRPEDMALYPDFLGDVSAEDLRLRFFARVPELSAAEVHKLSHLDYKHDMAFTALDEDTGRMLGLVRLKDEHDEKTAEFAILVRSRLKGHGLGWLLMRRVIDYAKESHRLRQRKRSPARVWRCVGRKHTHAANVRRTRFPRRGHRIGRQARCARSQK